MNVVTIIGFLVVLLSAGALLVLSLSGRRAQPPVFREIPAMSRLKEAVGQSVEDGTRLHITLGSGSLTTLRGAPGLAGLGVVRRLGALTALGDRPPVVSGGDAALVLLAQQTLHDACRAAAAGEVYRPEAGRLTGLTPFSYAAGALPVTRDEDASVNVVMGNFGVEVALLTDAAERQGAFSLAASDNLTAQAVLYATAREALVGEELFATGAYIGAGAAHTASVQIQDILRSLLIFGILSGVLLTLMGLL